MSGQHLGTRPDKLLDSARMQRAPRLTGRQHAAVQAMASTSPRYVPGFMRCACTTSTTCRTAGDRSLTIAGEEACLSNAATVLVTLGRSLWMGALFPQFRLITRSCLKQGDVFHLKPFLCATFLLHMSMPSTAQLKPWPARCSAFRVQ